MDEWLAMMERRTPLFHESDMGWTNSTRQWHGMSYSTCSEHTHTHTHNQARPRFLFDRHLFLVWLAGWHLFVPSRGVAGSGGERRGSNRNVEVQERGVCWCATLRRGTRKGAFQLVVPSRENSVEKRGMPFCTCRRFDGMNGTIWSCAL